MLQQINIKDLAIVSRLEVTLHPGMTVLTGETGAGKSILVDALGLILGDRADNGMIRTGCERAEITAIFDTQTLPTVKNWLVENALDDDGQCIMRRVLMKNGSSRAYINGTPAPLKSLQELGEQLVDIHGQHAHQSLLRRNHQRQLLDEFAAHGPLCHQTASSFQAWHETEQKFTTLKDQAKERGDRIDLLRYQLTELTHLRLGENELEEITQEHTLLSNSGRIIEQCNAALSYLDDDEQAALSLISRAHHDLLEFAALDKGLNEACELLDSAAIQVSEALSALRHYADNLELDPNRLDYLDRRLREIHDIARKYRCKPEELHELVQQLQIELDALDNADSHLADLEQQVNQLRQTYLEQAKALTQSRLKAAKKLSQQVSQGMLSLGMPHGRLVVEVETLTADKASAQGLDRIEFLVTANPGHPPRPLAKVASGGELSRISLAIQVATASCTQVPTLIFDEVDVGIGGGTAEIVGRMLRELGTKQQVLSVTHLPQVASQGNHHLRVEKETQGDGIHTALAELAGDARIEEIARMLGGVEITAQTLAHAREMVSRPQAVAS
ncbi:DNA repair protein RecN [Sedimenticola selenatireducens]|uniref:DNA repair protein RecN n=1 Tax=Sedimenticola selenatireducens TaxID=191960 RepID=A0A557SER8_9GAMM|nr:DNA repair protein RecN [Sedimenticola selenatireducens]TVO75910.1 DNA repair protein RecN [Sedimenticola selenatireducens]TVT63769.1 MAG: DNA repair protein RecN [Sedimenticola selenatireducens]